MAQVLAANATLLGKLTSGLAVSDSAASVANSLDGLQAAGSSIASIALTNVSPVLAMTATQLISDAPVLLKITGGYAISLSGTATVAQALGANATLVQKLSAGFAISDVSASVGSNLDALEAASGTIASIALTNGSPVLSMSAGQLLADATVLLKISGSYGIAVSGTATVAQVLSANATLLGKLSTGVAISDSAANVMGNLGALQADAGSIASIALTDNTPVIDVDGDAVDCRRDGAAEDYRQLRSYGVRHRHGGAGAGGECDAGGKTRAGFAVSDSSSNGGNLAALAADSASIASITLTTVHLYCR